jgi:LmbE family N-acetylglucosaminyl deacetylase
MPLLRCAPCIFGGALLAALPAPTGARARTPQSAPFSTLSISNRTRLIVVAPHPDDELLGAGGLMQRVVSSGGALLVIYLTDGDGYPEGVQAQDHVALPTADDFRDYGKRRQHEARDALEALGLGSYSFRFLGFPDGGLCRLTTTYWSERAASFRSPFTRLDRPPRSEIVVPDTRYRGEDLTQELATLIDRFQPTAVLVPRREDQHPDHCAAWLFVADALGDVARVRPQLRIDLLTYIIHYDGWPFDVGGPQMPPPHLGGGVSGWIRLPLTDRELARKRAALKKYESQMHVMRWFLEGFARTNETFSRPAAPHVVLPVRRSPCC